MLRLTLCFLVARIPKKGCKSVLGAQRAICDRVQRAVCDRVLATFCAMPQVLTLTILSKVRCGGELPASASSPPCRSKSSRPIGRAAAVERVRGRGGLKVAAFPGDHRLVITGGGKGW
eukprot:3513802-Pleurochrysis_carterae.AAC.2